MKRRSVLVVGCGLAGIAAALASAEQGCEVTVMESRPRLGGATYSFSRGGMHVDTGQHVFLRSYRTYRWLLNRLGVDDLVSIQSRLDIPVLAAGRPAARLRRARSGPAPLHLLPALAGYSLLQPGERIGVLRCASALQGVDPDDPATDTETFGSWLRRHGQGRRAVDRLWGLLSVAALNLDPSQASLALAARVFRTGLLDSVDASDIGIADVPQEFLHDRPARRTFAEHGIRLLTGQRARAIDRHGDVLTVRTDTGEVDADGVIMAVPHAAAATLAPPAASPGRQHWRHLGDSPIVNVHLHYDRPVTAYPFAAVLGADSTWVFDRTRPAGFDHGQYLVCSISAADSRIGQPAGQIVLDQAALLAAVFPAARSAQLLDSFVSREPRATFRQQAGSAALRPSAITNWPQLVLAGAWTATGWPDTMEGAVRSGVAAAATLQRSGSQDLTAKEATP